MDDARARGQGQAPYGQAPQAYGGPAAAARPRPGGGKALPLVLSAGLAVGVFTGLMIFVGDGKKTAEARTEGGGGSQTAGNGAVADAGAGPAPSGMPDAAVVATGGHDGGAAVTPPPGSPPGSIDAGPVTPPTPTVTLTVRISPADAEVEINGAPLEGDHVAVPLVGGKARIKISATASGYRTYTADKSLIRDETVTIKMTKRSSSGNTPANPTGPGGLIDL